MVLKNFVFFYVEIQKTNEKFTVHEHKKKHIDNFLNSIRNYHPNSKIIQCTNLSTHIFSEVDEVVKYDFDTTKLMEARIKSYSKLNISEPSIYLDTDMLIMRPIPFELFIDKAEVILLNRSFDKDVSLPVRFRGCNFEKHLKGTLNEIYPYIGCFIICKTGKFWETFNKYYNNLEDKYKFWFGDQEILKKIVLENKFKFAFLQESDFACPPHHINKDIRPYIIHFKGKDSKKLIEKYTKYIK